MDTNNWRPNQSEAQSSMDGGDWRSQLLPDSRSKIVNKIMDTLKRHLPVSGQEGLQELKQIAIRFEEKIYTAATNQSDYLRKISLKMLTMESKSQSTIPNGAPSNSTGVSRNPQDSGPSQNMQSQVPNQSQSVPLQMVSNQVQARQQLLAQTLQSNNIASSGMQTTGNLQNSLPSNNLPQNSLSNISQNTNIQSISGISQNSMGNTINQGGSSSMFNNVQRQQMHGRQQTQQVGMQQQQQQSQNAQQLLYQQQLKQKLQQSGSIQQQPMMQAQSQQQTPLSQPQQNLLQVNQQPMMQTSSVLQPSMTSGLAQNQQSSVQQPSQSVFQQQHSALRQPQQAQQIPIIQQQTQAQQQSMMSSQAQHQQQQQLIGQQPNTGNMQQNQLVGQHSNISDMQQQQQQQRLLGQQNNLQNLPIQQQVSHQNFHQQQHMIGQQSNLANMHQQQLGHQSHVGGLPHQQMMGTQSGSTIMQMNQHSLNMTQPLKASIPQQAQSGSLLPGGGQQSQQQLMSQLQSQPHQLQQQLGLQQSTNSLQQNMQSRMQNSNFLLQQQNQNLIDQQNKIFQAQRTPTEAPTTSLDSTAQTGGTNAGDWQEEVYQKIKNMKDMYYTDLNDMYQKISFKLQQHESLPQQPKTEQLDKFRLFKNMLEKLMQFLQTTKNSIQPAHKEKLLSYEKQIIGLINTNRPRRPVPPLQPGQVLPSQMQSMQQPHLPHSQISQLQSHEAGGNPQLQAMNPQGSIAPMQQSNVQHGSVPSLTAISSSQQIMVGPGSLQTDSNLDPAQGNATSSMQQVPMTSLQQNPASASQQVHITALQSQSGASMLQPNINSHQSNSNMLQNPLVKQHQEQQIMENPQFKQQLQNRHLQQQMLPQKLQQQQQFNQQVKQQQASHISANQMSQLHQNDVNEKMKQNLGLRSGAFPQHLSSGQRFAHQQLKPGGASFPVSSPQLLQAASPQISQHSPQIDQQNLQQSVVKGGTPLQSANSPFAPSPLTPLVPSPMPCDSEKPAVSLLPNAAIVGNQQGSAPAASQSLSIGTPGISASPLFECAGPDGYHGNNSAIVSGKSSLMEQPLDRLLKAVKSISPKALNAAVSDIGSFVSMIDHVAGSAPGNGSRATVGEDLVAMTKCRLQARSFLTQDGSVGTKRMRRYTNAMPLNGGAALGSMNDSFKQLNGVETSELDSTATSSIKKAKIEVNHALLEEIREINDCLIDTVVDVSDEDFDLSTSAHEGSGGTIVRCSFCAVSLSPSMKAHYSSAQVSPIQPLRLLVPFNYPNCSPILLDKLPVDVSTESEDLAAKAKSRFSISLRSLSQPMSLKEIAKTWDGCARAVICDYAQQFGGGTFSSKYGTWENCLSAA